MRPKLLMVKFEILPTAATLTSPTIPSEYLLQSFCTHLALTVTVDCARLSRSLQSQPFCKDCSALLEGI